MPREQAVNQGASVLALLMLYWALIAPASILHYVGVTGLYSTLLTLILAIAIGILTRQRVRIATLFLFAFLIFLSMVNSWHWNDARYIFYCAFFTCALVLAELAGRPGIERFCTAATTLIMALLIGAIFSFIIARFGVPPLFVIKNPDGQDYHFFYTSFTNSYVDNFIRASAIYDEPGAFSMYICFVAAMRHLLRRDRKATWLLLAFGFITFSLAHLFYVFCHFLAEQSSKRRIVIWLGLLLFALVALVTSISLDSNIILLSRLALTDDTNLVAGDNRSFQFFNAWSQITSNPSSVLFGLDSTCVFNQLVCQEKFGTLGENPLSPLAFGGLSSEAPYYALVLLFLISPLLGREYIVVFGMGLLFLQRPYVMGFSYSLMAVILLELAFRQGKKRVASSRHPSDRPRAKTSSCPRLAPTVFTPSISAASRAQP